MTDRQSSWVWLHSSLTAGLELSSPWPRGGVQACKSRSTDIKFMMTGQTKLIMSEQWKSWVRSIIQSIISCSEIWVRDLKLWLAARFDFLLLVSAQHPCVMCAVGSVWRSTLKHKVAWEPFWQEREEKVWVMSGRKRSMANALKERPVILGGLLWADVSFDATVRPQELQLPVMLPAGYFCHSVQRL